MGGPGEIPPATQWGIIGVLAVVGLGSAGGWVLALQDAGTEAPPPLPEASLAPTPATEEGRAVDEALGAVARAAGGHTIRCAVDAAEARWPFLRAHHDGGILRAVVPTERGTRLVWPAEGGGEPLGVLTWSGAEAGSPGGCRLEATRRSAIEGLVMRGEKPASGVGVRGCDQTVRTDAHGRFHMDAWAGQHCLVYVSQEGLSQDFEPVVVPDRTAASVTLEPTEDAASGPGERRVLVVRDGHAERALREDSLSDPAREVLRGWADENLKASVARTETAAAAEAVLTEE